MKSAWLLALPLAFLCTWPFTDRFLCGTDQSAPADAIVVLAGGPYTTGRLVEGLRLADAGFATNVIVSGVEYDPQHESFVPSAWALLAQRGLTNFVVDAQSHITRHSAFAVRDLARRHNWRRVLVVTSAFHWRRTRALFGYECPRTLNVRVCTVADMDFAQWWTKAHPTRTLRNELWFLTTFLVFHTPLGVGVGLLAAGWIGWWRLLRGPARREPVHRPARG